MKKLYIELLLVALTATGLSADGNATSSSTSGSSTSTSTATTTGSTAATNASGSKGILSGVNIPAQVEQNYELIDTKDTKDNACVAAGPRRAQCEVEASRVKCVAAERAAINIYTNRLENNLKRLLDGFEQLKSEHIILAANNSPQARDTLVRSDELKRLVTLMAYNKYLLEQIKAHEEAMFDIETVISEAVTNNVQIQNNIIATKFKEMKDASFATKGVASSVYQR